MTMAVVALLVVMFAPTAVAVRPGYENIARHWDNPYIVVTVDTFQHNDKWYQFRYYPPGNGTPDDGNDYPPLTDTYYVTAAFVPRDCKEMPDGSNYTCTDKFDVTTSGLQNTDGTWTVWLFKAGDADNSDATAITSARVYTTVDVPIPEFATITIPVVALIGLVALYRRKQKK